VVQRGRQGQLGRPLARFLAEHDACNAEFDVRREAGVGTLHVICEGCGATIRYPAESGVALSAGEVRSALAASAGELRAAPPRPLASATSALAAIIGTGIVLILAVALLSSSSGNSGEGGAGSPARTASVASTSKGSASNRARSAGRSPAGPRMVRREVADRFSVAIPVSWSPEVEQGALAIVSPRGDAEVECYFEDGVRPRRALVRRTTAFLRGRHPGARTSKPRAERLGSRPAQRVVARYRGGSETAVIFVAENYTYLMVARIDRGAPASARRAAEAILASLRPV
jgi:hypothetical protein